MKGKWRDILHSHLFLHPRPSITTTPSPTIFSSFPRCTLSLSLVIIIVGRLPCKISERGGGGEALLPLHPLGKRGSARIAKLPEMRAFPLPPSPFLNVVGFIPRPGPGAILFCPRFQKPSLQTEGEGGGAIKPQTRDSPSQKEKSAIPRVSRKSTRIPFF